MDSENFGLEELRLRRGNAAGAESIAMARSGVLSLLCACALAAVLLVAGSSVMRSFVGAPTAVSPQLRATAVNRAEQRVPEVAMQFFGGEPVTTTTTPPPMGIEVEDPNTYIIGITVFFFASVFANSQGFFNP